MEGKKSLKGKSSGLWGERHAAATCPCMCTAPCLVDHLRSTVLDIGCNPGAEAEDLTPRVGGGA